MATGPPLRRYTVASSQTGLLERCAVATDTGDRVHLVLKDECEAFFEVEFKPTYRESDEVATIFFGYTDKGNVLNLHFRAGEPVIAIMLSS